MLWNKKALTRGCIVSVITLQKVEKDEENHNRCAKNYNHGHDRFSKDSFYFDDVPNR